MTSLDADTGCPALSVGDPGASAVLRKGVMGKANPSVLAPNHRRAIQSAATVQLISMREMPTCYAESMAGVLAKFLIPHRAVKPGWHARMAPSSVGYATARHAG